MFDRTRVLEIMRGLNFSVQREGNEWHVIYPGGRAGYWIDHELDAVGLLMQEAYDMDRAEVSLARMSGEVATFLGVAYDSPDGDAGSFFREFSDGPLFRLSKDAIQKIYLGNRL